MSLREIAEITNIPKATILKTFQKYKVTRRQTKIGQAPYGFAYLEGKLVVDPKEHLIVRKIISFHHKGYSMRAISRELNSRKLFNRKGTKWHNGVIKSVIEYHMNVNKLQSKLNYQGKFYDLYKMNV